MFSERYQEQQKVVENAGQAYGFDVWPTCPPSTSITIGRGLVIAGLYWGTNYLEGRLDAQTCDFADMSDTTLTFSFASADYYVAIILAYYYEWLLYQTEPLFDCVGGTTEYETAAEAEAAIDLWLNGGDTVFFERFPIHGVVLKNNGTINTAGQVLPVDPVNRGRSYLYRDARPRNLFNA